MKRKTKRITGEVAFDQESGWHEIDIDVPVNERDETTLGKLAESAQEAADRHPANREAFRKGTTVGFSHISQKVWDKIFKKKKPPKDAGMN